MKVLCVLHAQRNLSHIQSARLQQVMEWHHRIATVFSALPQDGLFDSCEIAWVRCMINDYKTFDEILSSVLTVYVQCMYSTSRVCRVCCRGQTMGPCYHMGTEVCIGPASQTFSSLISCSCSCISSISLSLFPLFFPLHKPPAGILKWFHCLFHCPLCFTLFVLVLCLLSNGLQP